MNKDDLDFTTVVSIFWFCFGLIAGYVFKALIG
jgi:hypothetical protein